jgi:peptidoglycan/LPS O-acetylase OafA/YrhL
MGKTASFPVPLATKQAAAEGAPASASASERWLTRLSRRTTSGRFLPEVDGLRFVAIGAVVLFHVSAYLVATTAPAAEGDPAARLAGIGHYGVQVFFLVSGLVLALPFAAARLAGGPPVSLRAYFLRRLTRLEPPYLIALVAGTLLLLVVGRHGPSVLLPHLAAHAGYVHNPIFGASSPVSSVAWSLEIEVQFYVAVPALAALFAIRSARARRGVIVLLAAVAIAIPWAYGVRRGDAYALTMPYQLPWFLAGFLVADLFVATWRTPSTRPLAWDAAGSLAVAAALASALSGVLVPAALPVLSFVAVVAAFRGSVLRRFVSAPWIAAIGGTCYSIYLLHFMVVSAVGRSTASLGAGLPYVLHLALQAALIVPVVLLVSIAFYLLVEKPCMDPAWPRKAWAFVRAPTSHPR